jgi:hypothetical protein
LWQDKQRNSIGELIEPGDWPLLTSFNDAPSSASRAFGARSLVRIHFRKKQFVGQRLLLYLKGKLL